MCYDTVPAWKIEALVDGESAGAFLINDPRDTIGGLTCYAGSPYSQSLSCLKAERNARHVVGDCGVGGDYRHHAGDASCHLG